MYSVLSAGFMGFLCSISRLQVVWFLRVRSPILETSRWMPLRYLGSGDSRIQWFFLELDRAWVTCIQASQQTIYQQQIYTIHASIGILCMLDCEILTNRLICFQSMSDDSQQEDSFSLSGEEAIKTSPQASEEKRMEEDTLTNFIELMIAEGYPADKVVDAIEKSITHHGARFQDFLSQLVGSLTYQRAQIKKVLQQLPILADVVDARSLIQSQVPKLSQAMRKQMLEQYFWIYFLSQEQIVNKFKQHGYHIKAQYDDADNTDLMLLVTPTMREMFQHYGDCLSIDLIDRLYKKRLPNGFTEYSVWFLTGQDEHLANVLFGFAVINQQKDCNIQSLLKAFIKEMNGLSPRSICIPPSITLQRCLRNLFPGSLVFINWFHKLKLLKQVLQQQIEHRSVLQTICECFKTSSKAEFAYLLSKILSKVADHNAIKWGIQTNSDQFCLSSLAFQYIGFSIEPKKYIDLETEVRRTFIYQSNIARVFIYSIKLELKLNKSGKHQAHYKTQLISNKNKDYAAQQQTILQQTTSEELEQRIRSVRADSKLYKLELTNPINACLSLAEPGSSKRKIFVVRFNIKADHWECNCGFLWQTGVPCAHLVKVIEHFGGDLQYYVSSRWKLCQK